MKIRIRNALFGLISGLLLLAGLATPAAAQIVTVPTDLMPGDQYRLVFVTSTRTAATSTDINYYNEFVQAAADTVPELATLGPWRAIGSTGTVNARDNTDTNFLNGLGLPIYSLANQKIADNNQTFWAPHPALITRTEQGTDYASVVYTGTIRSGVKPFDGRNPPLPNHALGSIAPAPYVGLTHNASLWVHWNVSNGATIEYPLYAMSGVLTVAGQDSDGDGVNDDDDLCPLTAAGDLVDGSGCTDVDVDMDGDGICDSGAPSSGPSACTGTDNCPIVENNDQEDADMDGVGDACDSDDDNDGVPDTLDSCPLTLGGNNDQTDTDVDGAGDICDADLDGDGVDNDVDICPNDSDTDQTDTDMDGAGDACDANDDNDDFYDVDDNCSLDVNNGQEDLDGDNIGDACDADLDGDGVNNGADNCPVTLGGDNNQTDTDSDTEGDVCDADDDNDTILDGADNCPLAANTSQGDADMDGIGDVCNDADDADGDDWSDTLDNCPNDANGDQADLDGDMIGDACDPDVDGDGVDNGADNCAATPLGELSDFSGCTIAQLCPCDGPEGMTSPWKNHGKYVSCVARAANDFRDAGLIFDSEHGDIVSAAGQSACGNKNK